MRGLIFEKYSGRAIKFGEDLIIPKDLCSDFVKDCHAEGIAILGIEGYKLDSGNQVQPQIDEIADFSDLSELDWGQYVEKSFVSAEVFLNAMLDSGTSDGYCFELEYSGS